MVQYWKSRVKNFDVIVKLLETDRKIYKNIIEKILANYFSEHIVLPRGKVTIPIKTHGKYSPEIIRIAEYLKNELCKQHLH